MTALALVNVSDYLLIPAPQFRNQKDAVHEQLCHELRTPLNAISGFSDTMLSGVFGPLNNKQHRNYVQAIHDNAAKLLQLVETIFVAVKPDKGLENPRGLPAQSGDVLPYTLQGPSAPVVVINAHILIASIVDSAAAMKRSPPDLFDHAYYQTYANDIYESAIVLGKIFANILGKPTSNSRMHDSDNNNGAARPNKLPPQGGLHIAAQH
jgi:signal transduction histidine kinase